MVSSAFYPAVRIGPVLACFLIPVHVSAEVQIFLKGIFLAAEVAAMPGRPCPAPQGVLKSSQGRTYAAVGFADLRRYCLFVLESWNGMLPK